MMTAMFARRAHLPALIAAAVLMLAGGIGLMLAGA